MEGFPLKNKVNFTSKKSFKSEVAFYQFSKSFSLTELLLLRERKELNIENLSNLSSRAMLSIF